MAYQALYRKFRPQRFEDVIGQHHITTILKNQIQAGRTSHAYLFCGSRGTGKTSTAKIFARAVNCLSPEDGEACGTCGACRYMEENDVDIIEIDAASNNGVDDMRTLIDQARFTPLNLRYKIYIIDEVHMLSNSASNALLKTLEEPPQHVKFLLATTEPQKILPTVISRCQRFDFKRLNVPDILENLRTVLRESGVQMEEGGLYAIARAADGGMRDALSLLDQCMAFCGESIAEQDVYDVMGGMDIGFLFAMADALIDSDAKHALELLDDLVRNGRNLGVFVQDLAQHLRALLLVQICGESTEALECTPETMRRYAQQAERCAQERLLRAIEYIGRSQNEMKWLAQPRIFIEAMLVRICRPEGENGLLAAEDRIAKLEILASEGGFAQAAASQAIPAAPPKQAPAAPAKIVAAEAQSAALETPSVPGKASIAAPDSAIAEVPGESPTNIKETAESKALWEALRKVLQKSNPTLYVLSAGASSTAVVGNALMVYFPKGKGDQVRNMLSPKKYSTMQEEFGRLADNMQLHMQVEGSKQSLPEDGAQEEEMLRMFGDKLSIEE